MLRKSDNGIELISFGKIPACNKFSNLCFKLKRSFLDNDKKELHQVGIDLPSN